MFSVTFSNEGGPMDTRSVMTEEEISQAAIEMIQQAGVLYAGDRITVSDDDADEEERSPAVGGDSYVPGEPRCNEDLVRDLMNFNPTGALCQAFIVHSIQSMCEQAANGTPEATPAEGFISPEAWKKCAGHIQTTLEAFYKR